MRNADNSDDRSFTTIETSVSDYQEDYNNTMKFKHQTTLQLIPSIQRALLQREKTSGTSHSAVEPWATPRNQQQQDENVQIKNFFTDQQHLKQCGSALSYDHHNNNHNDRVNHSGYNSTGLGDLRAKFQTQNQDSIERMRNDISNDRNEKNIQWNKENQWNFQPPNQENSMQQNFNYLNQIQAEIDLLRAQIFQKNNENYGNRLPSGNLSDSNNLSMVTNQLSLPKSYSFYIFINIHFGKK